MTSEFVKKEFPQGTWKEELEITFSNEPPTTFIAIENESNNIVGFASYNAFANGVFGPTGVLTSLRGKGIGGLLLRWVMQKKKFPSISLQVNMI